jgi:predicted dehydrogenase
MSNKPIKIGLIGCGSITHFIHIPGLKLCPEVRLESACDSHLPSAEATAKKYSISKVTNNYHEVTQDPEIDAVIIATPNNLHKAISLEALSNGKHVLCEKPLGLNTAESDELVDAGEKSGKINMVSFVYRFVPAMRFMKHLVENGTIGEVRHFRAFYLQRVPEVWLGWRSHRNLAGSGELGDVGTHLIDFAHQLVGGITSVSGWTKTFLPERKVWGTDEMRAVDVDDASGYLAEFENGATGVFEATRMAPGRGCGQNEFQSVEINGSKGSLVYYLQDPFHLQVCPGAQVEDEMAVKEVPEPFMKWSGSPRSIMADEPNLGFRYDQAFAFIQAIRGVRQEPLATFADGRQAQRVVDAVLESAETRRWINVKK